MAHRTTAGGVAPPLPLLLLAMLHPWPMPQTIKCKPVPPRASRFRHRPAEGGVDPAAAFEAAIGADVDDDVFALVTADERRAGQWQPRVERWPQPSFHRAAVVWRLSQEVLRRANA